MRFPMFLATSALALTALAGCANWTIAPVGHVEFTTRTSDGEVREESVVGLLALPTPGHRTVILLPLFKSSRLPESGGNQLPSTVQSWANRPAESPPPPAPRPE